MIRQFLMDHFGSPDLRFVVTIFVLAITAIVGGVAWLLRSPSEPDSMFKVREADRAKAERGKSRSRQDQAKPAGALAEAKMRRFEGVLRLEGIRIDGPPHEVLGVPPTASPDHIQRAYRELMKRFHPDRVGRPGSREWEDAQRIAEAINRAKEKLLKKS